MGIFPNLVVVAVIFIILLMWRCDWSRNENSVTPNSWTSPDMSPFRTLEYSFQVTQAWTRTMKKFPMFRPSRDLQLFIRVVYHFSRSDWPICK